MGARDAILLLASSGKGSILGGSNQAQAGVRASMSEVSPVVSGYQKNKIMISIVIPVLNEEQILATTVDRVHEYLESRGLAHEIIVVSNGSTDRTGAIGEELARKLSWMRFYHLAERGAGRAFVHAVREARGSKIITLDADLSSDINFLDYANHLLDFGDMVLGSKTMGRQRRSPVRVVGSQLYILFTQIFFNLTLSDYSIGCKAFQRAAILPALDSLDPWTGYILDLALYLNQTERKIVQVGIDCDDNRESRFNILHEGIYRYNHLFRCWRRMKRAGAQA